MHNARIIQQGSSRHHKTLQHCNNGVSGTERVDEGTGKKKWLDHATNCELSDGLTGVCRLKQTCTPLGAARKYVTTITDVHILNYAVSLETCRITTNMQGVWKCKLPLASLPGWQNSAAMLAKSEIFTSDLGKMPRQ